MNLYYHFHSPWFLALVILLPVMIWFYFRQSKKKKITVKFPGVRIVKRTGSRLTLKFRHLPFVLRILAIAALIVALARPQHGENLEEMTTEGVDIMLLLDLSGSMDLLDMITGKEQSRLGRMNAERMYRSGEYRQYSRLGFAKEVITDFISKRTSDRIGLTVFASRAYTQCPLTLDYGILTELLQEVDGGTMDNRGTAIGDALMVASRRLIESPAKSRVIVLLTDGANTAGDVHPLKAAEVAKATDIKIYTVAVGKSRGTFLHFAQNPFTGEIVWQESPIPEEGGVDEKMLTTIAKTTGGEYYRARNRDELAKIYSTIDELEKTEIQSFSYTRYSEEFFSWLLAGVILLLLDLILSNTRFVRIP